MRPQRKDLPHVYHRCLKAAKRAIDDDHDWIAILPRNEWPGFSLISVKGTVDVPAEAEGGCYRFSGFEAHDWASNLLYKLEEIGFLDCTPEHIDHAMAYTINSPFKVQDGTELAFLPMDM